MRRSAGLIALAVLAVFCLQFVTIESRSALYNTTVGRVPGKLNVHIISHTHNDPGWLSSYVQYHRALVLDGHVIGGVEAILDTVIQTLVDNPDRTYVYADMAFFVKWWQELHEDTKATVRNLVNEGRFEFTNGGITQHDEATSHYSGMVDQMTLGMRFLQEEFGITPKIAWQLDGFGHSNTEPMLKAMGGFEALFFGRSDQADMEQRKQQHNLEMIWRGSQDFGTETDLWMSQYPTGNYGPPSMTWFFERRNDYAKPMADKLMDDPETHEFNIDQTVDMFVQKAKEWQGCVQGGEHDVVFFMGSDFTHSDARSWFSNIDKMIHYVNKDGRVNAFYSTPSRYVAAKKAANIKWALKTDDFFPYSGNAQGTDFWTGYFTSRPTLKSQVRRGWALLQATRQMELLAELQPSNRLLATTRGLDAASNHGRSAVVELAKKLAPDHDTAVLEFALATSLHHDGITGTQKKPVTQDYEQWLHIGMVKAAPKFLQGLQHLLYPELEINSLQHSAGAKMPVGAVFRRHLSQDAVAAAAAGSATAAAAGPAGSAAAAADGSEKVPQLSMCLLLNSSICTTSLQHSQKDGFLLVVYNPLGWSYESGVRIPVADGGYTVTGPDGKEVESQLLPISSAIQLIWAHSGDAKHHKADQAKQELAMLVKAPPLGHAVYKVLKKADGGKAGAAASTVQANLAGQEVKLSSGKLEAVVSPTVAGISSVTVGGKTHNFSVELIKYAGTGMQSSGAYTFKANQKPEGIPKPEVSVVKGPVVQEVRQVYTGLGVLVTRLWKGHAALDVQWTVGPPPASMNWEAFVRYNTAIKSAGLWFTDANGREFQQRRRSYRPAFKLAPSAQALPGNIYPVTTGAYIKDKESALHVAIDRAQGVASMEDGQMEFNLHRVSSGDDGKGMKEPLMDSSVALGTHIVSFSKPDSSSISEDDDYSSSRHHEQVLNDPYQVAFSAIPTGIEYQPTSTGLESSDSLPANVHLLTTKWLSCDTVLVRVSHMFQANEHPTLSAPAKLDLHKIIKGVKVVKIVEAMLYGERPLQEKDEERPVYQFGTNLTKWDPQVQPASPAYSYLSNRLVGPIPLDTKITLNPMQIRAFYFTVQRSHSSCVDPPKPTRKVKAVASTASAAGSGSAAADAVSWLQGVEAGVEKAAGGLIDKVEAEVGEGLHKAVEWEAAAVDQVKRGSAAIVHKIAGADTKAPLSRSALLLMLVVPFAVAVGMAYMLLYHSKRSHYKPLESKV